MNLYKMLLNDQSKFVITDPIGGINPTELMEKFDKARERGWKSNNWRKMHGIPLVRRRDKRKKHWIITEYIAKEDKKNDSHRDKRL